MKQPPLSEVIGASGAHTSDDGPILDALNTALDTLTDPEIPVVTLREMGILRAVRYDASRRHVEVIITPTYSGCPAMDVIADDIAAVLADQGVAGHVVTQLSPAWTTDWMNDTAREKLRAYGIAPPRPRAGGCTFAGMHQRGGHAGTNRKAPTIHYDDGTGVCCPRCHSSNTQEISRFGSTACKALYRCLDCAEPFDYFKAI